MRNLWWHWMEMGSTFLMWNSAWNYSMWFAQMIWPSEHLIMLPPAFSLSQGTGLHCGATGHENWYLISFQNILSTIHANILCLVVHPGDYHCWWCPLHYHHCQYHETTFLTFRASGILWQSIANSAKIAPTHIRSCWFAETGYSNMLLGSSNKKHSGRHWNCTWWSSAIHMY